MAKNVFISFRYRDGHRYKDEIAGLFDRSVDTIDFSEDQNRSNMSDYTIQSYLYGKLRRSSVTILLITPEAVNHRKNLRGYDDWIYDELRYSLEDRGNNRTNGLIAVYTPEAEALICQKNSSGTTTIFDFDNLARKNMMNIKPPYKKNNEDGIYDRDYDSYCSLVPYVEFKRNFANLIEIATWKRDNKYRYDIVKRL